MFSCIIPSSVLVPNKYEIIVGFHKVNVELIQLLESPVQFVIEETGTNFFQYNGNDYGCVFINCNWRFDDIKDCYEINTNRRYKIRQF